MSEEAEAAGPGQGEDRDGSFFAIFGEEPGPTMEISHQQVLIQSAMNGQRQSKQDLVFPGGVEAALRRTSPHCP